jgi:hypothetical protein
VKNSNGILELGDFYSDCVEVIKGSAFVNSGGEVDQSEIQAAVRDSSDGIHQTDIIQEFNV